MLRAVPSVPGKLPNETESAPADPEHDEVMGLIPDLVAGRLVPEERARVRDHLNRCPTCHDENTIRGEDMVRRAIAIAFPEPSEAMQLDIAKTIHAKLGIRVGPLAE